MADRDVVVGASLDEDESLDVAFEVLVDDEPSAVACDVMVTEETPVRDDETVAEEVDAP